MNATKCRKRGQRWRKRAQSGQLPSACPRPNPNEDAFGPEGGQKVSEKRAEVAEVNTLLAVGRCLHQQGHLQLRAKVEEVNIV